MNIVLFLLIGLIAGALAGRVVSGHGYGVLGDIVVGVVGAFLGGWIFTTFFGVAGGGILMSLVIAFVWSPQGTPSSLGHGALHCLAHAPKHAAEKWR